MPDPTSDSPATPSSTPAPLAPPVAERVPITRVHHGDEVVDDYEWLRDPEDPRTLAYLEAENAWTTARTEHLAALREDIFGEIRARTQETDLSVPRRVGTWWYYARTLEGQQYGLSCRAPVADASDWTPPIPEGDAPLPGEEVLLDSNALAEGHEFFSLGGLTVSPDGHLLAYATDTVGNERYTVRVKDLRTGEHLGEEIPDAMGGLAWDRDATTLHYVTVDASWRPDKVWAHRLGTPVADDVVVHHETDERFWCGVGRTRSNRFVVVSSGSKVTTEYRVLDAERPEAGFTVVWPRRQGVEYHLEHAVLAGEDRWLVLHNEGAPDFEVLDAPLGTTGPEDARPFLPHEVGTRVEDVSAFTGHVVVSQRSEGLTAVRVLTLDGDGVADDFLVPFDDVLHTVGPGGNPEFDQPTIRVSHTSLVAPPSVHDFDVATRSLTLLRRTPVLGGYEPDHYVQRREWATAADGTSVPVSLVHHRDQAPGPAPTLLYGYGSYEASMDPYFSTARLSLLDRGATFAIAHVRGGGEMGRHWYDEGKMLAKKNTFTDFVACARHLVDQGLASSDTLVAEGASAGGLLMGAVANLAPDLFAGIAAGVPFVDALTSILDPSLPLTVVEWEEWGNPLEDPEVYAYMKSYSPYENIAARRYPPILAETSLQDTRVLYVEPAKWVARLRATLPEHHAVLLRCEMAAGHGGVSGRYNAWRERAFTLAWILDRMGLADAKPMERPETLDDVPA